MPVFQLRFRSRRGTRSDDAGIAFAGLEDAYLHVCSTIPDAAQQVLLDGDDPLACAFVISDAGGRTLMEVPFTEVLCRQQWGRAASARRPADALRSARERNRLARDLFARTLNDSPIPHALVSLDFELLSLNAAALAMTGETAERVLGQCVFDGFEGYRGAMSAKLEAFYGLAVRGLKSRATNLSYQPPMSCGADAAFWVNAMAWPILDDHGRVLAVANCAVSSRTPWADGKCTVTAGHAI
jgi:PAS domain-containing protein